MKPRTNTTVKNLVQKYTDRWVPILGLTNFLIDIEYIDETQITENEMTVMDTNACWYNMTMNIRAFLPPLREADKKQIELAVVHELIHAIIDEAQEQDEKHLERVCNHLAVAFSRLT